ncbi:MAG: class I SAM-dependent methyltransferase [Xanthobacteraceae bacterium]|nr:class I SAM-dependent methyltransferase [Xanthobacteraceae bacterium]
MHRSSYEKMHGFRNAYLNAFEGRALSLLDVGSASVSGEDDGYRPLFSDPAWRYVGLDLAPARNVDVVVSSICEWGELTDSSFDVVISGQAFEHIAWPWITMMEIARVLRPGGLAAITAPSAGHVHRFPQDCWRFYPDGFPALAQFAGLRLLEQHTDTSYAYPENAFWGDVFVVLRRPERSAEEEIRWRRRHAATIESARGLDPLRGPEREEGFNAIQRTATEALLSLNKRRVKTRLMLDTFSRAWRILRTPLTHLSRE